MTAPYARVRAGRHRAAHLAAPGAPRALCGAFPPEGAGWLDGGGHPDCRACAGAARIAEAVAAWDAPPPRPGILAMISQGGDCRRAVGECSACGHVHILKQRGLCHSCALRATEDGTIRDYGWTRSERLAEYAGLRREGLGIAAASARLGVCKRTGERYEAALAASGRAQWRTAA